MGNRHFDHIHAGLSCVSAIQQSVEILHRRNSERPDPSICPVVGQLCRVRNISLYLTSQFIEAGAGTSIVRYRGTNKNKTAQVFFRGQLAADLCDGRLFVSIHEPSFGEMVLSDTSECDP